MENLTGADMVGGGALSVKGFGAVVGVGMVAEEIIVIGHGVSVVTNPKSINLAAQTYLINSSYHKGTESDYHSDNPDGTNLPEIDNSKAAANSKKMSDKEIGEMFNDTNWHKTKIKDKLIKKYQKELNGSTNFDFYIDKKQEKFFSKVISPMLGLDQEL